MATLPLARGLPEFPLIPAFLQPIFHKQLEGPWETNLNSVSRVLKSLHSCLFHCE